VVLLFAVVNELGVLEIGGGVSGVGGARPPSHQVLDLAGDSPVRDFHVTANNEKYYCSWIFVLNYVLR
jgi:hypothetical protein